MKELLIIIFLFAFIDIIVNGQFVSDNSKLLTDKEIQQLNQILNNIWSNTSVEIRLFIIDTLDGKDVKEYGLEIARKYAIGNAGVNNGILILTSKKDREITILVGSGIEWIIDDNQAKELINILTPFFKKGEFYNGFKHIIDLINNMLSNVDWKINEIKISKISKDYEGKVVAFKYKNTTGSIRFKYGLDSDPQFDKDFNIKIKATDDYNLFYTKYMNDFVSSILTLSNIKIVARLVDYDNRRLELLGLLYK